MDLLNEVAEILEDGKPQAWAYIMGLTIIWI